MNNDHTPHPVNEEPIINPVVHTQEAEDMFEDVLNDENVTPTTSTDEVVVEVSVPDSDDELFEPEEDFNTQDQETPEVEEDLNVGNQVPEPTEEVTFSDRTIDMRGERIEAIVDLLEHAEQDLGPATLDARVREVGSWENLLFRAINDPNFEEMRIQSAMGELTSDDRRNMSTKCVNDDGKVLIKTFSVVEKGTPGEIRNVSGPDAIAAFERLEKGGSYRIPLYNSGITVDLISPTGNDLQTLLSNCTHLDRQLGTTNGAHYFAFNDVMFKIEMIKFTLALIVRSSYSDWQKNTKILSVIKMPDLASIAMHLAALCYPDGFDNFEHKCTRPWDKEKYPTGCHHTDKFTANLFDMITTRFSVLSKDSIDFMVKARMTQTKHNVAQITKYQSELGLEGKELKFGNITFTMKIPSVAEYLDSGSDFLAEIKNEISGDNTNGQYEQIGLRYIRCFAPWVASVQKTSSRGDGVKSTDRSVIIRYLEHLEDSNEFGKVVTEQLLEYINSVQLTYVGYPVIACEKCGYTADTPSGMYTFDPFTTFFTLAFLSLTINE